MIDKKRPSNAARDVAREIGQHMTQPGHGKVVSVGYSILRHWKARLDSIGDGEKNRGCLDNGDDCPKCVAKSDLIQELMTQIGSASDTPPCDCTPRPSNAAMEIADRLRDMVWPIGYDTAWVRGMANEIEAIAEHPTGDVAEVWVGVPSSDVTGVAVRTKAPDGAEHGRQSYADGYWWVKKPVHASGQARASNDICEKCRTSWQPNNDWRECSSGKSACNAFQGTGRHASDTHGTPQDKPGKGDAREFSPIAKEVAAAVLQAQGSTAKDGDGCGDASPIGCCCVCGDRGHVWLYCDSCDDARMEGQLDCAECEKPEAWEELHGQLQRLVDAIEKHCTGDFGMDPWARDAIAGVSAQRGPEIYQARIALDAANARIGELRSERNNRQSLLDAARTEIINMRAEVDVLQTKYKRQWDKNESLKVEVAQLSARVGEMEHRNLVLVDKLKD